ncbi:hypothetical protein [Stappia sp.]|nr:hypothetical protein [Stappia sp.]|tara:strand:- start:1275 stop:1424 length:150 start_codon:yes stop_codon:yes gene_type:complete
MCLLYRVAVRNIRFCLWGMKIRPDSNAEGGMGMTQRRGLLIVKEKGAKT